MDTPSELLKVRLQNNLLKTELLVRQMQEQLDLGRKSLQEERRAIIDDMRKEVGAGKTDFYNIETGLFEPRKE